MTLVHHFAYIFLQTYLKIIKLLSLEDRLNNDSGKKRKNSKWRLNAKVVIEISCTCNPGWPILWEQKKLGQVLAKKQAGYLASGGNPSGFLVSFSTS